MSQFRFINADLLKFGLGYAIFSLICVFLGSFLSALFSKYWLILAVGGPIIPAVCVFIMAFVGAKYSECVYASEDEFGENACVDDEGYASMRVPLILSLILILALGAFILGIFLLNSIAIVVSIVVWAAILHYLNPKVKVGLDHIFRKRKKKL